MAFIAARRHCALLTNQMRIVSNLTRNFSTDNDDDGTGWNDYSSGNNRSSGWQKKKGGYKTSQNH